LGFLGDIWSTLDKLVPKLKRITKTMKPEEQASKEFLLMSVLECSPTSNKRAKEPATIKI
jgi:hypothetical protein